MKVKGKILLVAIFILVMCFSSCEAHNNEQGDINMNTNTYEQINASQAKEIMDTRDDYVIVDARTKEEYAEGHIEGAILIPEYEITEKAPSLIPQKDTLILVYCRSGRRSKIASEALTELGYTNVKEFGGIIDWHYETVTGETP